MDKLGSVYTIQIVRRIFDVYKHVGKYVDKMWIKSYPKLIHWVIHELGGTYPQVVF